MEQSEKYPLCAHGAERMVHGVKDCVPLNSERMDGVNGAMATDIYRSLWFYPTGLMKIFPLHLALRFVSYHLQKFWLREYGPSAGQVT